VSRFKGGNLPQRKVLIVGGQGEKGYGLGGGAVESAKACTWVRSRVAAEKLAVRARGLARIGTGLLLRHPRGEGGSGGPPHTHHGRGPREVPPKRAALWAHSESQRKKERDEGSGQLQLQIKEHGKRGIRIF